MAFRHAIWKTSGGAKPNGKPFFCAIALFLLVNAAYMLATH